MPLSRLTMVPTRVMGSSLRRPLSSAAVQAATPPPAATVNHDLLDDLAKALTPTDTVLLMYARVPLAGKYLCPD